MLKKICIILSLFVFYDLSYCLEPIGQIGLGMEKTTRGNADTVLQNNINAVAISTGVIQTELDNLETKVALDTTTIQNQLTAVATSTGIHKVIAGTNITISPTTGLGDVTINSSGAGGGVSISSPTITLLIAASDARGKTKAVADYICDNIDDDAEINTASSLLIGVGGKIMLSEGTFRISNPILINSSITLEGCGMNTVIVTSNSVSGMTAGKGMIRITTFNVVISNLTIDGNKNNNTVTYCAIELVGSNSVILERLNIRNLDGDGIIGSASSSKIIITNCFFDTLTNGIATADPSTISSATISNCVFTNIVTGLYFYGFINCSIINNVISNSSYIGIFVGPGTKHMNIQGNTVRFCAPGIFVSVASSNAITGNICSNNTGDGIFIENYAPASNGASCNNIFGNTCGNNSGYGIRIEGAKCALNHLAGNLALGNGSGARLNAGTGTTGGANSWSATQEP